MTHPITALRLGVFALLVLALGLATGVPAPAFGDSRPKEIRYDTPGPIPALDASDYRKQPTRVVRITNHAIHPRLTVLRKGERIAWVSASRFPSTIVFEREVARSMVCHGLVNFSLVDDELRSASIHAGEYASFCELAPGRYRYRIVHDPLHGGGPESSSGRVDGVIVVGSPS